MDKNPWNRGKDKGNKVQQQLVNTSEAKFKQAQTKFQASVQKHLDKEQDLSSSGDEEDVSVSNDVLTTFQGSYSKIGGDVNDLGRTGQILENLFQSGAVVCLICISTIKKIDSIWNCQNCFGVLHLMCIGKWAKDSVFQQKQALENYNQDKKIVNLKWPCPKCRSEYLPADTPSRYYCFCGKIEDPPHHPWLVPHSCGETCNKPLVPNCGHYCLLLCHPGPCPPCPKQTTSSCHCLKQKQARRCSKREWSCGSVCGKQLTCKKHTCNAQCHSGQCEPCPRQSVQYCDCGRLSKLVPCSQPNWKCDKVCGDPYSCGYHKCQLVCHSSSCGDCPLTLERTCPCGKSTDVLPCTQDVPTCGDTCLKVLECGAHLCSQKCHRDKCGSCLELVVKVCRCGAHRKELPCQKEYLCESKCKQVRDCLRHWCNRKCCDGDCPPCEKPCGRTLGCGYHKCTSVCHRGPCYPCPQLAQVKCHCSDTVLSVPCGRQKKTRPPRCNKPCRIPPDCHHSSRTPHSCHFGECPSCSQVCMKKHDKCGHLCPAKCHSAVWVTVEDNFIPSGPWEKNIVQNKRCELPCPDCLVPTQVKCIGDHETSTWPCYSAKVGSCGRPCGRPLACTNHTCQLQCHDVSREPCETCQVGCAKPRPIGCCHPCTRPCHPGDCEPCHVMNKIKCHCGLNFVYVRCGEFTSAGQDVKELMTSCNNQCPRNFECGHRCRANCHPGPCPNSTSCKKKVKVTCSCGRLKREFPCDVVRSGDGNVNCDEECNKKKEQVIKLKEEEEKRRLEEEKRRNKEEVEKFEKKFSQGRKRQRERNRVKETDEETFFSKYWIVLLSLFIIVLSTGFYFLLQ